MASLPSPNQVSSKAVTSGSKPGGASVGSSMGSVTLGTSTAIADAGTVILGGGATSSWTSCAFARLGISTTASKMASGGATASVGGATTGAEGFATRLPPGGGMTPGWGTANISATEGRPNIPRRARLGLAGEDATTVTAGTSAAEPGNAVGSKPGSATVSGVPSWKQNSTCSSKVDWHAGHCFILPRYPGGWFTAPTA